MKSVTEAISDTQEAAQIAAETMLGDLMKCCIDNIEAIPDVWERCSEDQQDEVIERVRKQCESAVNQCVRIIATTNKPCVSATVEQVIFKDGIKAVLTAAKGNPDRHELADATGTECLIVLPYAEQFKGGDVKPDPNQRALPMADDALAA